MDVTLASEYWGQDAAGQLNTSEVSRYQTSNNNEIILHIFRPHIQKQNNILSSNFSCTFLRHQFFSYWLGRRYVKVHCVITYYFPGPCYPSPCVQCQKIIKFHPTVLYSFIEVGFGEILHNTFPFFCLKPGDQFFPHFLACSCRRV